MPWAVIIPIIVGSIIPHTNQREAPCFEAELNIVENESRIFLKKTQHWTNGWNMHGCTDCKISTANPAETIFPRLPPWSVVLHMFINALK